MKLIVGDKVRPLADLKWLQGEAIQVADPKRPRPVLVEFWSTWCGPCVQVIPHLDQLHAELGERVGIVGITPEPAETVKVFMAERRGMLTYPVALDPRRRAWGDYMDLSGHGGIPHAFLVGPDGTLLWQGHSAMAEEPIRAALAGQLTAANAVKRGQMDDLLQELSQLMEQGADPKRQEQIEGMLKKLADDPTAMELRLKDLRRVGRFRGVIGQIQQLLRRQPEGELPAPLRQALRDNAPEGMDPLEVEGTLRLNQYLQLYAVAGQRQDMAGLVKWRDAMRQTHCHDPHMLGQLAELLLDGSQIVADPALALALAERAVTATEAKDAGPLALKGRALFALKRPREAAAAARQALAVCTDASDQQTLEYQLGRYEAAGT